MSAAIEIECEVRAVTAAAIQMGKLAEKPIPFTAPMVRAIMAGTKTQTRRIVKHERTIDGSDRVGWHVKPYGLVTAEQMVKKLCPYGVPGDRLWVREAFRFTDVFDCDSPARVGKRCLDAGYRKPWAPLHFETDGARMNWQHVGSPTNAIGPPKPGKLRPSMFMPRWASRITLELTGVRVERLQDISEDDAIAEGVAPDPGCRQDDDAAAFHRIGPVGGGSSFPLARYAALWESINGPGSWDANPWVWCVSFKRAT